MFSDISQIGIQGSISSSKLGLKSSSCRRKTQLWADMASCTLFASFQTTGASRWLRLTASSISSLQISEITESGLMTNRKVLAASMPL